MNEFLHVLGSNSVLVGDAQYKKYLIEMWGENITKTAQT